jgi:hypothetical protein
MSLADSIYEAVMDTYRKCGAQDAQSDLGTFYDLLCQDRKLGRVSEEEYQETLKAIREVKGRLITETASDEAVKTPAAAT